MQSAAGTLSYVSRTPQTTKGEVARKVYKTGTFPALSPLESPPPAELGMKFKTFHGIFCFGAAEGFRFICRGVAIPIDK